jgi:hypothetical protein
VTTLERARPRRRGRGVLVLLPLARGGLVYQASNAAFTATTANPGNSWSSGTVVLADSRSGTALFTATNSKPGDTQTKCINVTYSGSLPSAVKLYVSSSSGSLLPYLDLVVTEGTGATDVACTGFTAVTTLSAGGETVSSFAAAHTAFSDGVSAWTPAGTPPSTVKSYRFQWTLQNNNSAQGLTGSAGFTWEAQNT